VKTSRRTLLLVVAGLVACQGLALAHERFIRHVLMKPMHQDFFGRHPGMLLGMDPNMVQIGVMVTLGLAAWLVIWFLRETIDVFVRYEVLAKLSGTLQRTVHHLAAFLTDKPVRVGWFYSAGEWANIMFLRSPALVLMYSATNDSLVMPSYPLEPSSAQIFKFAQAALAILILTQSLYPLCGALVLGTWVYLFRWGPFVAADALPVVTVAVVYMTSPWASHKLSITRLNAEQTRLVRIVLGFGFLVLGWLKIYNYNLTAAVADNYPGVMNDPLVGMFALFTDPMYRRETWVLSFALAEVLSGFMLMTGIFARVWAGMMLWVFVKLMVVDFGWDEIPHIYPIGATLAVIFSNHHNTEFDIVQRIEKRMRRDQPFLKRAAVVVAASLLISFLAIGPMLYALTFTDRSALGYLPAPQTTQAAPPSAPVQTGDSTAAPAQEARP
jgi:uncharacterized membrane protein YphA (DoxX/SURF4 family)